MNLWQCWPVKYKGFIHNTSSNIGHFMRVRFALNYYSFVAISESTPELFKNSIIQIMHSSSQKEYNGDNILNIF